MEECHENRWLLPTEFMIKKRERASFLGMRLKVKTVALVNEDRLVNRLLWSINL